MTAHLAWSTFSAVVAVAAALALRGRSAALRHGVLLIAVLRFALPTPWLAGLGSMLARRLPAAGIGDVTFALLRAPGFESVARPAAPASHAAASIVGLVWAVGCALVLAHWMRRLWRSAEAVRPPEPAETEAFVDAKQSLGMAGGELRIVRADQVPAACGWWRPCVVLPEGLSSALSAAELRAVIAHELAHVRRRDNLTGAAARAIVAVFWFHPLLWWMERRMLAERERACDEMVLARGASAQDYLAGILKVCRMSFAGATGYAGATGSNLKNRMEQIMSANVVRMKSSEVCAAAGVLVSVAVLMPLAGGFLQARPAPQAADAEMRRVMEKAEELLRQRRTDEAMRLVQAEADQHPEWMDVHKALGNMAVHAGKYDLAIAEFQRVIDGAAAEPKALADGYLRLGETYRRKGDWNAAMMALEKAREADPNNTAVIQTLALVQDSAERREEAKRTYEEVLRLDPRNGVALNNLAYLLSETGGNLDEALEFAKRAQRLAPNYDEVVDTVGWIYLKKGAPQEAIENFKEAVERDPKRATFHYHLGLALAQQGDRAAAREEFEAALRLNPPAAEAERIQKAIEGIR